MKNLAAVTAGVFAGLALFATTFYAWMIWGADPSKDSLVSW